MSANHGNGETSRARQYDPQKHLINDVPVSFLPELARLLGGANEAIFLQQVHWLSHNSWDRRIETRELDGRLWVRIPPEVIVSKDDGFMRYLDVTSVKRIVARLKAKGVLLTANLNKASTDKTNWYAIDYSRLNSL